MKTPFPTTIGVVMAFAVVTQVSALSLTGTVRDFSSSHPDFEYSIAVDPGIVEATLGSDGLPVYAGLAGNPTTTGAANFNQWYRDVSGVNQSTSHTINLTEVSPGLFEYANNSFFPIDNMLLGNEGRAHNYHFTFMLDTTFTYQLGQYFTFSGDDDVWVFINDQLVVDLGGVHTTLTGSVDLDTLGLTIGNTYDLDFFFAERHTSQSNFKIQTSIPLTSNRVPDGGSTLGLFGLALIGLAASRRRRA